MLRERIPTYRGLAYPDIIEAVLAKKIRAVVDDRHKPDRIFPNRQDAAASLETRVSRGPGRISSDSDLGTCRPGFTGGIWGEKEGTYTNSERRVSKVNAAVAPPGEAEAISTSFLPSRANLAAPMRFSLDGQARAMPSMSGAGFRSAGSATTPASPTNYSKNTAASSGRIRWVAIRHRKHRGGSMPMASFPTADGARQTRLR